MATARASGYWMVGSNSSVITMQLVRKDYTATGYRFELWRPSKTDRPEATTSWRDFELGEEDGSS